jgi:hypothetical protein
MSTNNSNINSAEINPYSSSTLNHVLFFVFLLLDISSILCSLILFYYFFFRLPQLRKKLANHILICLLISCFLVTTIDVPLKISYFYDTEYVSLLNNRYYFCVFWILYDYTLYAMNLWLLAFASLERYFLIFYRGIILKTKIRRLFSHYLPILVLILFCFIWYLCLVVFYPCEQTQFDYTQTDCGGSCYLYVGSSSLLNADAVISALLPMFLDMLTNIILIFHVIYQKEKMRKNRTNVVLRQTWKRTRKMFLQLVPIMLIFLLFETPYAFNNLLGATTQWSNTMVTFYTGYQAYCLEIFMPFVVLSRQQEIRKHLLIKLRITSNRTVAPEAQVQTLAVKRSVPDKVLMTKRRQDQRTC